MKISSWNFVDVLTSEEVSLILNGANPDDFEMRVNYPDDHFKEQGKVHRWMVIHAQKGALNPCGVEVAKLNEMGEVDRDLETGMFGWRLLEDDDFSWKSYPIDNIRFYVHRNEVFRWLLTQGFSEENIPDQIRNLHEMNSREELVTNCQPESEDDVGRRRYATKKEQQTEIIIRVIKNLGFLPAELPKGENGKGGVKALVKKEVIEKTNMFTESSFKHMWHSLRKEGVIGEK